MIPRGPKPYPQETRRVQITEVGEGGDTYDLFKNNFIIREDVVRTLNEAGFPAQLEDFNKPVGQDPPEVWMVKGDATIRGPKKSEYDYVQVEVVSPAYYYSASSLKAVESAVSLLVSTYCLHINSSTGLHCHVGCGKEGFSFLHMKHLVLLLWLMEPQISSIHPPERFANDSWCKPMRSRSSFTHYFWDKHDEMPGPSDGLLHFLGAKNMDDLLSDAGCSGRYGAYNFTNLEEYCERKTIEFRGHSGCLDPAKVRAWIMTLVGIVGWVRDASTVQMEALFRLAHEEKWQKNGDETDELREKELGPILAEGRFTLIDLLKHMELYEPALFYSTRMYKHTGKEANYDDWE